MFTKLDSVCQSYRLNKNNTNPRFVENNGLRNIIDELLSELIDKVLPHGSGIDSSWTANIVQDLVVDCHNSYHAMDQNGMYCGYVDFIVRLDLNTKEFDVTVCKQDIEAITADYESEENEFGEIETNAPYLDDLDDYLYQTVDQAIECYYAAETINYLVGCQYYRELIKRALSEIGELPSPAVG